MHSIYSIMDAYLDSKLNILQAGWAGKINYYSPLLKLSKGTCYSLICFMFLLYCCIAHFFYKQRFYKQCQAQTVKKSNKC